MIGYSIMYLKFISRVDDEQIEHFAFDERKCAFLLLNTPLTALFSVAHNFLNIDNPKFIVSEATFR